MQRRRVLPELRILRQLSSDICWASSIQAFAIKIKVRAAESFHPGQMILPSPLKTNREPFMKTRVVTFLFALTLILAAGSPAFAAVAVPSPLSPASGSNLTSPLTISWSAVTDPSGILGYNWQVSTSSTLPHGGAAEFHQRRHHPGHGQRPAQRHIFLAGAGRERRVRKRPMVIATQLQHHRRGRGTTGRSGAFAHQGLFHVSSA